MTSYDRIEKVIRHIQTHHQEQPRLSELSKVAGLSAFHFHRLFTRWAGITPKAFLKCITNEHAKRLLARSRDLLDVSFQAGLSGPGRLHDLLVTVEGVSPGEFKSKGAGIEIRYGFHQSPFGVCLIGLTERGVCHLAFLASASDRQLALKQLRLKWPKANVRLDARAAKRAGQTIFSRRRGKLAIHLRGTGFQVKVWQALLRIPPGALLSYGDIAKAIGKPSASRAVGTAVGSNGIGFLIPCHRVIRDTGILGDYRWGPERKRALLAWESGAFSTP